MFSVSFRIFDVFIHLVLQIRFILILLNFYCLFFNNQVIPCFIGLLEVSLELFLLFRQKFFPDFFSHFLFNFLLKLFLFLFLFEFIDIFRFEIIILLLLDFSLFSEFESFLLAHDLLLFFLSFLLEVSKLVNLHFSATEVSFFDEIFDMQVPFFSLFFSLSFNFFIFQFFLGFQKFCFVLNLSWSSVKTIWKLIKPFFGCSYHFFKDFCDLLPMRPCLQILFHHLKLLSKLKLGPDLQILFPLFSCRKQCIGVSLLSNKFLCLLLCLLHVS